MHRLNRFRRIVSFCLLFVLATLILKNLSTANFANVDSDCQEFGHIHNYKMAKTPSNSGEFDQPQNQSEAVFKAVFKAVSKNDLECRESKDVFGYSLAPMAVVSFQSSFADTSFSKILNIRNNFKDLVLEPQKRPPKNA